MQIDRAKQLAKENGLALKQGITQWDWDLFDSTGAHLDTLHMNQILHLKEEDYIQYYLED